MGRRLLRYSLLIALIGVAIWGGVTIYSFNHFEKVVSRFDGQCQAVAGIIGPEDVQFDYRSKKAFISSYDHRTEKGRGSIYLFNVRDPLDDTSWEDRTAGVPELFAPRGLHFYDRDGVRRLFVVNGAQNTIELYDVDDNNRLIHIETFSERRLRNPKDVVAVGPRAFYVTNDRNDERATLAGKFDFLTRAKSGVVFYFNGTSWHRAADQIRYANGLAVTGDGSRVFVAETSAANLLEYDRDPQTGYLTLRQKIKAGAALDNINIDQSGLLWIGAHPRPLALARQKRDSSFATPSKVLTYNTKTNTLSTIYADDGSGLSAASSAAHYQNKLIIGSLFEEKFLLCDMARSAG